MGFLVLFLNKQLYWNTLWIDPHIIIQSNVYYKFYFWSILRGFSFSIRVNFDHLTFKRQETSRKSLNDLIVKNVSDLVHWGSLGYIVSTKNESNKTIELTSKLKSKPKQNKAPKYIHARKGLGKWIRTQSFSTYLIVIDWIVYNFQSKWNCSGGTRAQVFRVWANMQIAGT